MPVDRHVLVTYVSLHFGLVEKYGSVNDEVLVEANRIIDKMSSVLRDTILTTSNFNLDNVGLFSVSSNKLITITPDDGMHELLCRLLGVKEHDNASNNS